MSEKESVENEDYDFIRAELENRPKFHDQVLAQRLYNEFLKETRSALGNIRDSIGIDVANTVQSGTKNDLENGEFEARFGYKVPGTEVFLKLHGQMLGDELLIQIDEKPESMRLDAENPDWIEYKSEIQAEIRVKLMRELQ